MPKLPVRMLPLCAVLTLCSACGTPSPLPPPPFAVPAAQIPPLPASARQAPRQQSYSERARLDIEQWLQKLTEAMPPDSSASSPTTR